MLCKRFIIVVTVMHSLSNFVDTNTLEWTTCNKNIDNCLNLITTFAPRSLTLYNTTVCRILRVDNVTSLRRSGDAARRPCGPRTKNCYYQRLQFGLKHLQLNCTLTEGLLDMIKILPGLKIPLAPPDIPAPIMSLWNANPGASLPTSTTTSVIGHWTEFDLKVEVMRDQSNNKYPVIKSELLSDHKALRIWCEGRPIFQTFCESVAGFSETEKIFGNIGQIFLRKLLPEILKDKGKEITTCSCPEKST